MVIALTVLTRLRLLVFQTITAAVDGIVTVMARADSLQGATQGLKRFFADALGYWQWLVLGYAVVAIMGVSVIGWWALSRVLTRLRGVPDIAQIGRAGGHRPDPARPRAAGQGAPPLPAYRSRRAARGEPGRGAGEHIAVTGANGSGKTTLMLILAGREPTSGTVERPGAVGLGRRGGTAVIMQHPESQVLGTRIADDVVWGLPPDGTTDIDRLLREVGLAGLAERDTGLLSGGELQRLAVAAALARNRLCSSRMRSPAWSTSKAETHYWLCSRV